jgi:hypothetical protein
VRIQLRFDLHRHISIGQGSESRNGPLKQRSLLLVLSLQGRVSILCSKASIHTQLSNWCVYFPIVADIMLNAGRMEQKF